MSHSQNFKAVIFDMDGVLVDSMPYHFLAWYESLRPMGVRVNCFEVYAKEGERWEKTLRYFLRRAHMHPEKVLLEKIFSERQRIFKKYFKRFIFHDTEEFLVYCARRNYQLALVTGTPQEEVKKILPQRIRRLFRCIVGGDDVRLGKPHPEPYKKAARFLNLEPRDCLVIENAPFGIRAAKDAGMFCVALTTSLPRQYLQHANVVVDNVWDVSRFLKAQGDSSLTHE